MSNQQAAAAVAALKEKRQKEAKIPYLGDDCGGTAKLPPSTSAWAVQWRPASTPSRKELQGGGHSPGPKYYPDPRGFGKGPHGIGQEYSMMGGFRKPRSEKRGSNEREDAPGPKYSIPDGFDKQVESAFPSRQSGKFSESKRETTSWLVVDSPGPAHYDPPRTLEKPPVRARDRDRGRDRDRVRDRVRVRDRDRDRVGVRVRIRVRVRVRVRTRVG